MGDRSLIKSKTLMKTCLPALVENVEFLDFRVIQRKVETRLSVKLTELNAPTSVRLDNLDVSLDRDMVTGVTKVEKQQSVLLNSPLDQRPRTVLIRELDAGKSTCFRYVTIRIANAFLNKVKKKALNEFDGPWVELYIRADFSFDPFLKNQMMGHCGKNC